MWRKGLLILWDQLPQVPTNQFRVCVCVCPTPPPPLSLLGVGISLSRTCGSHCWDLPRKVKSRNIWSAKFRVAFVNSGMQENQPCKGKTSISLWDVLPSLQLSCTQGSSTSGLVTRKVHVSFIVSAFGNCLSVIWLLESLGPPHPHGWAGKDRNCCTASFCQPLCCHKGASRGETQETASWG